MFSQWRSKGAVLLLWLGCTVLSATEAVSGESNRLWNLHHVDILTVVDQISKETGRNFIIDPRVKGTISIVSQKEMDSATTYQVFLSALQVLGFTALEGEGATKILPDTNAKSYSTRVTSAQSPGMGDEMVVRVLPLKNVSAQALVPVLRNLVAQQGHLAPYQASNVLIVADVASNVQRIAKVVESIENANSEDIDFIPLENATASDLVQVLTQLLSSNARMADMNPVTLGADDHSNAILISGDQSKRARIRALVQKLDVSVPDGGNTEVIYLKYQRAEDLVPALQSVSDSFYGKNKEHQGQNLLSGAKTASSQSRTLNRPGLMMSEAAAREKIKPAESQVTQVERQATGVPGIQSEPNTNALILSAPTQLMRSFKNVIAKLDIRRRQVLVEAAIVELSADTSREIGINWLTYASNGAQGGTSFPGSAVPALSLTNTLANQGTGIVSPSDSSLANGAGLAIGFIRHGNLRSLLAALSADTRTNVLSTPSLVALDNQKSMLSVGQQLPFQNGSYASTNNAATATPYNTIEYRDVALTLEFVPQITKGRAVQLDLDQQVNHLISNVSNQPITSKREVKTSVLVNDHDILVLGGLMETKDTQTWQRVPILGDIPLLGALFSHKVMTRTKTNLMVFIKPTILREPSDGVRITGAKYSELEEQAIFDRNERFADHVSWDEGFGLPPLHAHPDGVQLPSPF